MRIIRVILALISFPIAFILSSNALQTFVPAWLATIVALIASVTIMSLILDAKTGLKIKKRVHVSKADFGKIVEADSISIDAEDLR